MAERTSDTRTAEAPNGSRAHDRSTEKKQRAEGHRDGSGALQLWRDTLEGSSSKLVFGLAGITVLATSATGVLYDPGTGILVLAGGILLAVIGVLWASVRTLSGDAPITLEEAVALGAPTAAEEQKRAVLQALKDLEYERSMGKIAEADYQELLARYRNEAKRLLRAVDDDFAPLRAKAEAYVAGQLARMDEARAASPQGTAAPSMPAASTLRAMPCPTCETSNDIDALFCKKCGSKLSTSAQEHRSAPA